MRVIVGKMSAVSAVNSSLLWSVVYVNAIEIEYG